MGLSIKDRLKAFKRCMKIIFSPKTEHINLLWETKELDNDGENKIFTHTFFKDGEDPVKPMMVYMARVAGHSNSLEELNTRAGYYLSRVAIAYMHFKPSSTHELKYIGEPIIAVEIQDKDSDEANTDMDSKVQENRPTD